MIVRELRFTFRGDLANVGQDPPAPRPSAPRITQEVEVKPLSQQTPSPGKEIDVDAEYVDNARHGLVRQRCPVGRRTYAN